MSKRWTPEEVAFLLERFQHEPLRSLARKLGRTKKAVARKANKLGLKKSTRKIKIQTKAKKDCPKLSEQRRAEDPFVMNENVYTAWPLVHKTFPICQKCNKIIQIDQIARWHEQKIYHNKCLQASEGVGG